MRDLLPKFKNNEILNSRTLQMHSDQIQNFGTGVCRGELMLLSPELSNFKILVGENFLKVFKIFDIFSKSKLKKKSQEEKKIAGLRFILTYQI